MTWTDLLSDWIPTPEVAQGLVFMAALYYLAVGPLRAQLAPGQPYPTVQARWFLASLVVLYLAVGTPLDSLGERYLFSLHMVQHNLLMFTFPTLLLRGVPPWLWTPFLEFRPLARAAHFLTRPVTACLVFNFVFTAWHVPAFYEWALRDRTVHLVEHLTMIGSSILMWWPIMSNVPQLPRAHFGQQMLYAVALMILQIPVFFFLTFTSQAQYPSYAEAIRITSLTPLEDQQLGGIVMKIVGMAVSAYIFFRAFWLWSREESKQ